ncbi:uncharacterized protein K02A2.6-like [Temnothorax curvispinosus]|uniref:RNA-directed DNA polymerase n=1 Tax=Temnothorax curvispinosus TaxID=300111 RepID=A0A6J1PK35_9HYME|nr:uncharacterized protein K02A2.6-like [Temnothorax curvispinosus]
MRRSPHCAPAGVNLTLSADSTVQSEHSAAKLSELHPGSPALDSQPATSPTSGASSVHQMYAQPPNLLKSDQGVTPNLLKSDQGVTPNLLKSDQGVTSQHNVYLEDVLQHFPTLFADDLGTCNNFKVKVNIAKDARPVQSKCRQIPYAMEALLAEELKRLESLGIIESVATSNWTSPIVIAKKQNGKIRLCGDYSTGINSVLISNSHSLPTVDNINAKLNGNRYFSVLDLSDAFFQLEIDKDHREITTIVTPFGLYRYTREPFGLKTAPADFQQAMDNTLEGLEGVSAYFDDVIVRGRTRKEHHERLFKTLQRLQDRGWRLRAEKCRFGLEEIKYLGSIVNAHGISADPEATNAIASMPKPISVPEVQSFLGMVNHYGKFIPHLHEMKQALEDLTRENRTWSWDQTHDLAFNQIKKVMLSPLLLDHYDPSKTLIVAADACATGIGAVLLQRDSNGHERAVYHMSQSLIDAQRNYSQLEKEALALVTAVERFHKFVWGKRFILQTDHKPLVALLQTENTKGLKATTAARLKRWALRLMGYDFKIEFIRTQDFGHADALSRLIDKFRRDNAEELQVASIQAMESELLQLKNRSIDFFDRGVRVVIPEVLRPTILAALHKDHPGIRKTKQLAREFVYWPKMSDDIEHLLRQCDACALNQKLPIKVPLDPWPAPSRPMERVHIDFAGPIEGQYLLIFVDAYSKFLDVAITPTISAARTVDLCREFFSRFGPPEVLVTDHGTQFTSELFAVFCKEMQISHLLAAVNHLQSNGQAERMVDTVKRAIAKDLTNWKRQLFDFLHSYRYTPCSESPSGKSPAELLFGRRMNSPFSKLLPKPETHEPAPPASAEKQLAMEKQFLKHHGARPRYLTLGDRVIVLTRKDKREQGVIHKVLSQTRYSVRLEDGRVIDRHFNHIWKRGSDPSTRPESLMDDWSLLQPPTPETPLTLEVDHQPAASPAAQTPVIRNLTLL